MTRLVSYLIYHLMYTILYLAPIVILMFLEKIFGFHIAIGEYLATLGPLKFLIILPLIAYMFILPGYRAKLASSAYGDRAIGFWEAHFASGVILRSHLSFLPVIGRFFEEKEKGFE